MDRAGRFFAVIILGWVMLSSISFGYSGGDGSAGDPYQIASKADLLELAADTSNYDKCFILTADIDMGGQIFTTAIIAPDTDDSNYIFDGIEFTGTLDGNTHQIKIFTINGENNHYIGLLGQIGVDGQIKNLAIVNATIQGNYYVGGLVGGNHGIISLCYVSGAVSGNGCVGGLAGANSSGTISFCHAAGSVDGNGEIGGLVGFNCLGIWGYYESTIRFCYATGEVSGDSRVGGLVGNNSGSTIISCFATGAVNGYSDTGGLLGNNEISFMSLGSYETGKVVSCYAAGTVSGEDSVGGLLGTNIASHVTDSYSTGFVTGILNVGGLVGWSAALERHCETVCNGGSCVTTCEHTPITDTSLVEDSFWNRETSGQMTSSGGTGKTTGEMRTLLTFTDAGWDFTNETTNGTNNIWRMCADGVDYPRLNWEAIEGDFACPDGVSVEDLDYFVGQWLLDNCTSSNNYCGGADVNASGKVDLADYAVLAGHWLEGVSSLGDKL